MRAASALLVTLALGLSASGAASQSAGIDLRLLAGGGVLARRGARPGGGGEAVRIVAPRAVCDGTLGPNVETPLGDAPAALVARVSGCTPPAGALFAIVRPAPMAGWPVARPAVDPRAAALVPVAEAAAATAGHLRGTLAWDAPRVYEVRGTIYVLVSGPSCAGEEETGCSPAVAALVRAAPGGAPEVLLARPAHWLWTEEELVDCSFAWEGVVDVDGDGVVEIVEVQRGESAFMIRLVRPGSTPAGDVVWLASYRDDPTDATVGRPARPVTATAR